MKVLTWRGCVTLISVCDCYRIAEVFVISFGFRNNQLTIISAINVTGDSVPAGGEHVVLEVAKRAGVASAGVRRRGRSRRRTGPWESGVVLRPDHTELVQRKEWAAAAYGKGSGVGG